MIVAGAASILLSSLVLYAVMRRSAQRRLMRRLQINRLSAYDLIWRLRRRT